MSRKELDKLQRVLDYHLGLDSPRQRQQTEQLLAEDAQLRQLHEALGRNLRPLQVWPDEQPPAGLAQRTLKFVAEHGPHEMILAAAGHRQHPGGYDDEDSPEGPEKGRSRWVVGNLRDILAVAACLMVVFMVWQPAARRARQKAQEIACAAQLRQSGVALAQYGHDQGGFMPYVPRQPGDVWWYVGQPGSRNTSNTRNLFLLVKLGYRPLEAFVCPGQTGSGQVRIQIRPEAFETMNDFARRGDVNYSLRLLFDGRELQRNQTAQAPVLSDQNPLFDPMNFDSSRQAELDLSRQEYLWRSNSPNHGGRGQNVLFGDGRVHFIGDRHLGPGQDDIFTIQSTTQYRGTEQPKTPNDVFIAP